MAEDDIYKSKRRFESFVKRVETKEILNKIDPKDRKRKYYCKNKENLKYFYKLFNGFKVDDISFIRRFRICDVMMFLVDTIECDLKNAGSKERDKTIIRLRDNFTIGQLKREEGNIKQIGKLLFNNDLPDFFKDFKIKVDVSKIPVRQDKLTYEEFDKLMKYFSNDSVMQAFLSVSFEALSRPQELFYTKISDLEINQDYAIINITTHKKERAKKLLCIDSKTYLLRMYNSHPDRNNKDAYLFLNKFKQQITPFAINKKLRIACNNLGIKKPITAYSLKRFGVTYRRLKGDDENTIMKIAGWRKNNIRTYDLSDQDDVFKIELAKRGLIKDEKFKQYLPQNKECPICHQMVGFADSVCDKCNNIVDPVLIKQKIEASEEQNRKLELFDKFYIKHKEAFEKMLEEEK